MPVFSVRLRTIFSSPSKAPPQTNRMLVVSTWTKSWFGCLRPPCGGTEAMVPSTSFRDRKSTRLNSSHSQISYAVFCLKKKTYTNHILFAPRIERSGNLPDSTATLEHHNQLQR